MNIKIILNEKKSIFLDLMLSLIATGLPIAIMQLVIYPKMAKSMSADTYGLMQTIYSGWFVIAGPFAGCISNIKLLQNSKYRNKKIEGDFPIILKKLSIFVFILTAVLTFYYYRKLDFFHILLSAIVAILYFFGTYYETEFRIDINYRKIVINKIVLTLGYIFGLLLFLLINIWELIYVFGYGFSLLYCVFNSKYLLKEKYIKTALYYSTLKDCGILLLSNFASSLTSYGDKLILYPLMGGDAVSIYYTSTLVGKAVSLFALSLRDVILSYVSKIENNNKKIFIRVLEIGIVLVVVSYFLTLSASDIIVNLLFPQWINEVRMIIPIVSLTSVLDIYYSLLYPFTLKFCDKKWQMVINLVSVTTYFVFSIALWTKLGLNGFCYGILIGEIVKILLIILVYLLRSKSINE